MAYSVVSKKTGKTYYLHSKEVTLKGGRQQVIYYFAGEVKDGALDALPSGYIVIENERTGLDAQERLVHTFINTMTYFSCFLDGRSVVYLRKEGARCPGRVRSRLS